MSTPAQCRSIRGWQTAWADQIGRQLCASIGARMWQCQGGGWAARRIARDIQHRGGQASSNASKTQRNAVTKATTPTAGKTQSERGWAICLADQPEVTRIDHRTGQLSQNDDRVQFVNAVGQHDQ